MKQYRALFFNKMIKPLISLVLSAAVLTLSLSAWFTGYTIDDLTNELAIGKSPVLYLLDSDTTTIIELNLTGLSVGVPMSYVFCVSSVGPTTSIPTGEQITPSTNVINLELAHTNNLNVTYSISKATYCGADAAPDAFPFTSQNGNTLYYTRDGDPLTASAPVTDTTDTNVSYTYFNPIAFDREYNFFILTIGWEENDAAVSLQKETDVIYIIAKGGFISETTNTGN